MLSRSAPFSSIPTRERPSATTVIKFASPWPPKVKASPAAPGSLYLLLTQDRPGQAAMGIVAIPSIIVPVNTVRAALEVVDTVLRVKEIVAMLSVAYAFGSGFTFQVLPSVNGCGHFTSIPHILCTILFLLGEFRQLLFRKV